MIYYQCRKEEGEDESTALLSQTDSADTIPGIKNISTAGACASVANLRMILS